MIINIDITKDLKVSIKIDDELIENNKKKQSKWVFWIQKKWMWDKIIDDLTKEINNNNN